MSVGLGRPLRTAFLLMMFACVCTLSPASASAATDPPGTPAWVSPAGGHAA